MVIEYGVDPIKLTEYAFSVCNRCNSPFLTKQAFLEVPGEFTGPQDEPIILFPDSGGLAPEGLPATVARAYTAAVASYRAGLYEPCAIMCRKCLEAICHEASATGRNLFQRLKSLQEGGVVDGKLLEWADGLRIVGNDAAHDLEMLIGKNDARDALQFVEAILMYIFILGRRFEEFQKRRASKRAASPSVPTDGYAAAEHP